jgi:tetratricopeptide (TPR) repeat protein
VWQVIYEELRDRNFEMIAVAFDTAGTAAVEARIRAADCREQPAMLARLMGWAPELWARQSPPTYPCLIDEAHVVAELYGMVNVPQGVWIDEAGRIVRPAESAGTSDMVRHMDRQTFEVPDAAADQGAAHRMHYIDALRDWVAKGAASRYVLPPDEIRRRLRGPREEDVLAATHVRLGRHLYRAGKLDAAKRHFEEAVRLCPEKWNYLRQSMMLDPAVVGQLNAGPDFWAAVDALGDEPYYPVAALD